VFCRAYWAKTWKSVGSKIFEAGRGERNEL